MTFTPTELTDEQLVGARDALAALDDEIYSLLTRKSNRIAVAIDVNNCTSQMLAETQAELARRRKEKTT